MARKVTKIDDTNHPGHGFWSVEGVDGYFREHDAKRVAGNLSEEATPKAVSASADKRTKVVIKGRDYTATCPSCGHAITLAPPEDAPESEGEDEGEEGEEEGEDAGKDSKKPPQPPQQQAQQPTSEGATS